MGGLFSFRIGSWSLGGGGGGGGGFGAHTYWRVYIEEIAGLASFAVMVNSQFRDSEGTNLIGGGTAFASSESGAGTPAAEAFFPYTTSSGNYWSTASGQQAPSWYGYQFASPVEVASFTMTGVREAQRMPRDFKMQYSDDGVSYTDTTSFTGEVDWLIDGTDIREFVL